MYSFLENLRILGCSYNFLWFMFSIFFNICVGKTAAIQPKYRLIIIFSLRHFFSLWRSLLQKKGKGKGKGKEKGKGNRKGKQRRKGKAPVCKHIFPEDALQEHLHRATWTMTNASYYSYFTQKIWLTPEIMSVTLKIFLLTIVILACGL